MKQLVTLYILWILSPLWANDDKNSVKLSAKIDLHAEKYTKNDDHTVDKLYGRANLTAKSEKENFDGQITIRAYPSGFGFEEPRKVEGDTSVDLSRFQVLYAWFKHTGKWIDATVGRQELFNSNGAFFGNYLDEGASAHYFMGKGVRGNALKLQRKNRILKSSLSIGIQNSDADDGYIRFYQTLIPFKNKKLKIHGGYRSNLFDHVHQEDSKLHHNFVAACDYAIFSSLKIFAEIGFVDVQDPEKIYSPILIGVTIPSKDFFDQLQFEIEYLEDCNNILDRNSDPLLWSLYGQKSFSNHYQMNAGIFSADQDISHIGIGFRFTGSF